jgi:zinc protease
MEDLGAASLDDIREFFATWYRPDNCVLTIVGDFAPEEAMRLVEKYFGDIAAGGSFPPFTLERKPLRAERREIYPTKVPLPRLYRLYHLPKMGEREWVAADLLSSVLSGDKATRLEKALVMEQQIATDVAAYVLPTEATGMLMLHATANEGVSLDQIEQAVDAEIARVAKDGVAPDELTRAQNRAEVDYAHQIENFDSRGDLIGMMATYFGNPGMVSTWLDPYRSATGEQLASVAETYLVPENRVTIHFVPEEG